MRLSERLAPLQGVLAQKEPPPQVIEFGEWLPDQPPLGNPGCLEARNVIPRIRSYAGLPDFTVASSALTDYCRGAFSMKKASDGATYFYCGDETNLYEIRSQTATDKSSATYASVANDYWEFASFGSSLIATNFTDPVQSIEAGAAGNFADHFTSTAKPRARTLAVIRDQLVLGYVHDGSSLIPNRVAWSALGVSTDMDESVSTQADHQDILFGGEVTKVVGGVEYGIVFSDQAIHRMTYVGSPIIWQFDAVDRQRGCPFPRTIAPLGRNIFYFSEEGYFVFDGSASQQVGHERIDDWFLDQIDPAQSHRMSSAIDRRNHIIVTSFPGDGSSSGSPNLLLFYDYGDNRFSYGEVDTEIVVSAATQAFTLEDLDALFATLEDVTPSLDSDDWKGGVYKFAAFTSEHKLAFFTGSNLAATMISGERQLTGGRLSRIEDVRPLIDGTSVTPTVSVGGRNLQTKAVAFDSAAALSSEGLTSQRNKKRYHRFRTDTVAGDVFKHIQGVEVTHRPAGRRGA